ncbi:MAG: hypothetical protein K6A61_06960 [Butyrivibrio sp.]|nr:hypothetical protein [Butyrivibrio sp.]
MKIAQSNVNLMSSSSYSEGTSVSVSVSTVPRGSFSDSLESQKQKLTSDDFSTSTGEFALGSETYNSLKPSMSRNLNTTTGSLEDQLMAIRTSLLEQILRFMRILGGEDMSRSFSQSIDNMSGMIGAGGFMSVTTITESHFEEEAVTFEGTGTALTEDGRNIDFGIKFSMSTRFVHESGISIASPKNFLDPLTINVGSEVTTISDQNFYFDINCDGKKDKISNLSKGSGFLALDKNGDGHINDGSELFGTKSGNGFKDLSAYDHDGNGWIDENDDVYNALKVWIRNEDGTDTLLSLKEADVGAIYLGSAITDYSLRDSSFNTAAKLRASGVFLKESGGVGTIQQIDMATQDSAIENRSIS